MKKSMKIRTLHNAVVIAQHLHLRLVSFPDSRVPAYGFFVHLRDGPFHQWKYFPAGHFRNLKPLADFIVQQKPGAANVKIAEISSLEPVFKGRVNQGFIKEGMGQQDRILIRRRLNGSPQISPAFYTTKEWISVEGDNKGTVVSSDGSSAGLKMTRAKRGRNAGVLYAVYKYRPDYIVVTVEEDTDKLFNKVIQ